MSGIAASHLFAPACRENPRVVKLLSTCFDNRVLIDCCRMGAVFKKEKYGACNQLLAPAVAHIRIELGMRRSKTAQSLAVAAALLLPKRFFSKASTLEITLDSSSGVECTVM